MRDSKIWDAQWTRKELWLSFIIIKLSFIIHKGHRGVPIIIMIVVDHHYVLGSPPFCPPSWRRAFSGQMASSVTIVASSCNIKNEMQSFSEMGNVLHKKNKETQELRNRRINPERNCSRADLSFCMTRHSGSPSDFRSRRQGYHVDIFRYETYAQKRSDIGGGLFLKKLP